MYVCVCVCVCVGVLEPEGGRWSGPQPLVSAASALSLFFQRLTARVKRPTVAIRLFLEKERQCGQARRSRKQKAEALSAYDQFAS